MKSDPAAITAARPALRFYAGLFFAAGALFVARERIVLGVISWAAAKAGQAPLSPCGPSLWLGLTGSLMCVIAWLALRLSEDPAQPSSWEALLLSKAVSSALFLAFCARTGNILFLAAACLDLLILSHLAFLRARCDSGPGLAPRLAVPAPFYEVWFARLNDAAAGRALWVRYALTRRGEGAKAACWAIFFDGARDRAVSRSWEGTAGVDSDGWTFQMGPTGIAPGILKGSGHGVSWALRWSPGPCPPAAVVAPWVRALGLSRSGYDDVAPAARFDGSAVLDGENWEFSKAFGCVGHVWGERYGSGWWWAHAILPNETVFEILSARGPLGLRLTSAFLWKDGRMRRACGPLSLLRNGSRRDGDRWLFHARFGELAVEGEGSLGQAATLRYEGPDGRRLVCRNSKLSALRLRLTGGPANQELETRAAAMEFAEEET